MKNKLLILRIYRFYIDGFRQMTLGKTLWVIILVKLFILFFIFKLFFFPRFLEKFPTDNEKAKHVSSELIHRSTNN